MSTCLMIVEHNSWETNITRKITHEELRSVRSRLTELYFSLPIYSFCVLSIHLRHRVLNSQKKLLILTDTSNYLFIYYVPERSFNIFKYIENVTTETMPESNYFLSRRFFFSFWLTWTNLKLSFNPVSFPLVHPDNLNEFRLRVFPRC